MNTMIKNKVEPKSKILDKMANFYAIHGFSDSCQWFSNIGIREEFANKNYLDLAKSTNFIKLKKIIRVVDIIDRYIKIDNKLPADIRIIDIGCGSGLYTCILASLGYNIIGVDLNEDMIRQANDRASHLNIDVKFLCSDVFSAMEYTKINVILALDTLEHLENPKLFCNLCYRYLSAGGIMIIIVPNGYSIVELIYHPLTDFINEKFLKKRYPKGYTHIQRFSLRQIRKLIEIEGFKNIEVSATYSSIFAPLFLIGGFRSRLSILNLKIADIFPKASAGGWILYGYK